MTPYALTTTAMALGGAMLLFAAGVDHLRHPRRFAAVLEAQRLLPPGVQTPVAAGFGVVELAVGACALVTWLVAPWSAVGPLAAVAVVYAAFGAYTVVLRVRRPSAPSGCLGGRLPTTSLVVARAWILAAGAAAALTVPPDLPADQPASTRLCR